MAYISEFSFPCVFYYMNITSFIFPSTVLGRVVFRFLAITKNTSVNVLAHDFQ